MIIYLSKAKLKNKTKYRNIEEVIEADDSALEIRNIDMKLPQ